MYEPGAEKYDNVSILDVLALWPCARAIFEHVPVRDLVRSERVSRRWQHAVDDYLPSCSLALSNLPVRYHRIIHRVILLPYDRYSKSSLLYNTVAKLGLYIVKLTGLRCDVEYLDVIASNCPNLQHLVVDYLASSLYSYRDEIDNCNFTKFNKLNQISFKCWRGFTDLQLSRLLKTTNCENIEIENNTTLTGIFLKNMKRSNLKLLNLNNCPSLTCNKLHSVKNLLNITSLSLNNNGIQVLSDIHLLLNEMPKLEELSLREYKYGVLSADTIKSFSRLQNLRLLNMMRNCCVNDALLEALAQGCRKLQYLNLCGSVSEHCARGVAALYRRPATTICLDHIQDYTSENLASYIRRLPCMRELLALGVVELSDSWLEELSHASQERKIPLELRNGTNASDSEGLKIILYKTNIRPRKELNIVRNFGYVSDGLGDVGFHFFSELVN